MAAISAPTLVVSPLLAYTDGYGLQPLLPAAALALNSDHGSACADREALINNFETMGRSCPARSNLKTDLFLQQGKQKSYSQTHHSFLGATVGVITIRRAARRIGKSCKPAWDRAGAMNTRLQDHW